jgi:hypothetical protein
MSKNEKSKILLGKITHFFENRLKKGTKMGFYRDKPIIIFFGAMHKLPPGLKIGNQPMTPWRSLSCFTIYIIWQAFLSCCFFGKDKRKEKWKGRN